MDHALPDTWPYPVYHVEMFLAFVFDSGYAYKTAATYISAISYFHKLGKLADPTQCFTITSRLKGFRRLKPSADRRQPIMFKLLVEIHDHLHSVCFNEYETILFQTAYSVAFFGLFRVGELTFTTRDMSERPILISDLILHKQCATIKLRKIKIKSKWTSPNC